MYGLILAGGRGTRLWPLSRKNMPKQMLAPLGEDKSLLAMTIERIQTAGFPSGNIHLITAESQKEDLETIWNQYSIGSIIAEPEAKNTGPAVLLGVKYLLEQGASKDEPVYIFPSDHYISNFHPDLTLDLSDKIICFYVKPTRPETGYGYIEIEAENGLQRVKNFKEKPDAATAKKWFSLSTDNSTYTQSKFFWNSGIYGFSAASLERTIKKSTPELFDLWADSSYADFLEHYPAIPKIPFDKLVAEKADNLYALKLPATHWRDIGTWESVHEALSNNHLSNVAAGKSIITAADSSGCLGYSTQHKLIAFAGVENIAVIETPDCILIVDKNNPQAMQDILETVKSQHSDLL